MKHFYKILAVLMAMFLLLSLTVLPAFADDDTVTTGSEESTETTGSDVTPSTTSSSSTDETSTKLPVQTIVWLAIGGVALLAAIALGIVFRDKLGKFFRVYKSEIKKIVWLPWNQTCKSTLVVLVILIVCAAAICLVDLGLSKGFLAFLKLFQK